MKGKNGLYIKNITEPYKPDISSVLVSGLCSGGMMMVICDSFGSLSSSSAVFTAGAVIIAVLLWFLAKGKFRAAAVYGPVIIITVFVLFFFKDVKDGMLMMGNDFLSFLTAFDGRIHLEYSVPADASVYAAGAVITMLVPYIFFLCAEKKHIYPALPVIFAVSAGMCSGFVPVNPGMVLLFAGLILLCAYIIHKKSGSDCSLRGFSAFAGVMTAGMMICLLCVFLPESMFEEKPVNGLWKTVHELKYHDSVPAMPEGELNDLAAFEKSDAAALMIKMDCPQKMYLRGMVGDVYTESGWEEHGNDVLAEYQDMFYWLHKYGYYSSSSVASAYDILGEEVKKCNMSITPVGACRENIYYPCALSGNELSDASIIRDSEIPAKGTEGAVTYQYIPGSVPEWYLLQNSLASQQTKKEVSTYLAHEESYRDFVYKNYLQLNNSSIGVLDRVMGRDKEQRTLAEIREKIFDTLSETLTYDESAVTKNSGNDFFRYFMEQTKKGYSVHYATAAVLMLRYYGVPARYVEGYFLSGDEASEYEPSQTIILTESHAHAWAEYYLDGIGWIPFEVTPGYVDDEELKISGENVSHQQIYLQNRLKYTPPVNPEERQPLSDWRNLFRIKKEHIFLAAGAAAVVFIVRTAIKRRRLKRALLAADSSDNRQAVRTLYGYADLLSSRLEEFAPDEEIRLINRKAAFSPHPVDDEDVRKVKEYLGYVKKLCGESWNIREKIKYRFLECIYL